jgi:hypothetical protein
VFEDTVEDPIFDGDVTEAAFTLLKDEFMLLTVVVEYMIVVSVGEFLF